MKEIIDDSFFHWFPKLSYHYAPIMLGLSQEETPIYMSRNLKATYFWTDDEFESLYTVPTSCHDLHPCTNKIHFSPIPYLMRSPYDITQLQNWESQIVDVNYIYSTEESINIKNIRMNAKKFTNKIKDIKLRTPTKNEILDFIDMWYAQKLERNPDQPITDYGSVIYLCENYDKFKDIKVIALDHEGDIYGISMWGILQKERKMAIHLICKSHTPSPYDNDYLRLATYKNMFDNDLLFVNDGGDSKLAGIRNYKMKFRPALIIPVYELNRKF